MLVIVIREHAGNQARPETERSSTQQSDAIRRSRNRLWWSRDAINSTVLARGTPLVPGGLNGQLSLSELKDQIYQALLTGELSVDYFQDRAGHVAADGTIVLGKGGIVAAWSAPALRSKLISLIQFVEAARSNPSVRPQ